jgi:hypothetical protein
MLFKRLNRTSPEQVFVVMQANEANIAADDVVQLELTAASVDGVKICQPNTAELKAVIGVADAAIGNGSYGLVQVYGYRSTSRLGPTDSTQSSLGQCLTPVAGQDYFSTITSLGGNGYPIAILLESMATGTSSDTVSKKIFLRAM